MSESSSYLSDVMVHLKDFLLPIAVGLGYVTWRIIKWIGLGFIDDVNDLKKKTSLYVTNDTLTDIMDKQNKDLNEKIDQHFTILREDLKTSHSQINQDLKDVHGRIDDISKTMLVKHLQEMEG